MTLQPPLRENLVGTLGVERNRFRPDATEAVDGFGSPEPMMSGAIDIRQQRASVAELFDTLRMYLWAKIRDPTYRSEDQLCVWLANDRRP
jgi:hypothetical protein